MRHGSARATPPASGLGAEERATLWAVARAVLPAGRRFPAASEAAVDRIERLMADRPSLSWAAVRLLRLVNGWSRLRYRAPLATLSSTQALALLERWRRDGWLGRTLVRLLTAPLKLSHYHDPVIYGEVGCRFGVAPPVPSRAPRWRQERVIATTALAADETLECDVVVVGTGAGGAVVAKELAEQGLAVVLLEEGDYPSRADFTGHVAAMQHKLYRDSGATLSIGNTVIPIPIGRTVGGTTTINSGTCYRTPDRILEHWSRDLGLDALAPSALAPFFDRVEAVLNVAPAEGRHLGGVARVIARGCDRLGYRQHQPLRRNAPGCDGQGVCCFGCPTDAKRSTQVSYVPLALQAGATLYTGVRAERVLIDRGRAFGVLGRAGPRTLTVRAERVVVACGALLTPLLLEASGAGLRSGQLGRNLSIHPAVATMALFDERIDGSKAIPQGYAIEQFHDEGLLFEGVFAPLDLTAATLPQLGPRLVEILESYDRLACFGVMLEDESRGRVRRGPGGRPLITYWLSPHDVARLKRAVEILARVYFAAGAKRVLPLLNGFDELRHPAELERLRHTRLRARDFDISAYHPLGTAQMGRDPDRSVVGPDHQVHDTPGLYVVDGSVIPSSPAVNPQVTIMALATRAADEIARGLT